MATFSYVARDQLGKLQEGTAEAENDLVLRRRLRDRGLWVQKLDRIREVKTATVVKKRDTGGTPKAVSRGGETRRKRVGGVKARELTMFCRQFSTMINAGVSLVRCLAVLEQQAGTVNLKTVIREVQYSVESGETLTRSLSRFPRIFNNLFIGLVRAGEVGGVLDETLDRLATFLEEDLALKRKVKAAMTYPMIVMILAVGIVIGLVTFIVPKFMELFKDFNLQMPAATQVLIDTSKFLTNPVNDLVVIGTIIVLTIATNRFKATKVGKQIWDRMMLKLPIVGALNHRIALARFSRTMSTLLVSGVPILQALETVAGAIDNEVISGALLDARTAIREGERIADPLERSKLFPPMVVQMITIGEETGALDSMLAKVADFYEGEVDAALESLTSALEPILIVFLGGIVGFIVVAMFMPLVQIINGLSSGGG